MAMGGNKFLAILLLLLCSCSGGGKGGGVSGTTGGGAPGTPEQPLVQPIKPAAPVDEDQKAEGKIELAKSSPLPDIIQFFQNPSFAEIRKFFPQGESSLSREESDLFIDNYLTQSSQVLSSEERDQLTTVLFCPSPTQKIPADLEKKILELNLLQTFDVSRIDPSRYSAEVIENYLDSIFPLSDVEKAALANASSFSNRSGLLDKNCDGTIDWKDSIRLIAPRYSDKLSEQAINDLYYYWSYFVAITDSNFENNMWPNREGIYPPLMGFMEDAVILDFRGQLRLKEMTPSEAQEFLKKTSYPIDLKAVAEPIYQTIFSKNPDPQTIAIDNVLIRYLSEEKPQISFFIKDNPLTNGALILTPSLWVHFKSQSQLSFWNWLVPSAFAKTLQQEVVDAINFWDNLGELVWGERDKISARNSTDLMSADFDPARFKDSSKDFQASTKEIQSRINKVLGEANRVLEGPKKCPDQKGYNDKNGCALKKLLQTLVKLQERLKEEQGRMYWVKERAEEDYRDALSRYQLSIAKGTKKQDLDHLTSEILLAAADALSILFDAKQAGGSLWAGLVEAGKGTIVEEVYGKLLEVAAYPLDLGPVEEELMILLGAKAGTGELNEVYGAASDLAYKRKNPKAAGAVTSFGLGFGIAIVRGLEDKKYENIIRTIENKIASEAHTLDVTSRNLLLNKGFGRFLNDQNNELEKMITQTEGALEKSQTHHSEAKRKQCSDNYEQVTQTLNQNYETEKQNLEQSLEPFRQTRDAANQTLEKHEKDCQAQELETDRALEKMRLDCAVDVGQSYCDKAMARFDQAMRVYEKDLQCLSSKTGQDLIEAQRQLNDRRQSVDDQIKTLEQNLQRGLAQAAQTKQDCLQAKEPECDVDLPVATSDQSLQTLYASLDDSLAALSPLGIKCAKDSFDCDSFGFRTCWSNFGGSSLIGESSLCRFRIMPPEEKAGKDCKRASFSELGESLAVYEISLFRDATDAAKYFGDVGQPLRQHNTWAIGEWHWSGCGVTTYMGEPLVNGQLSYRYDFWRYDRRKSDSTCRTPSNYHATYPYFRHVASLGNCVIRVGSEYESGSLTQSTEAGAKAAISSFASQIQSIGETIANNPDLAEFCQPE